MITRTSEQPKKPIKPRKCRICRQEYAPRGPMQRVCSPDCAVNLAALERNKRELTEKRARRREIKAQKDSIAPLQKWLKRAEKAVNAYCRERDREAGCISCGTHDADEWHAGHLIPVGRSSGTRYDPANINKQCRSCNYFGAGRTIEYEARLIAKIGKEEVERLKNAPRLRTWTREELAAIEIEYRAKLRELKKEES